MNNFGICRICMAESRVMLSIFGEDALWRRITCLADVNIEEGDNLPQQVCMTCAKDAINACNFKKKCEESDNFMRLAIMEKQPNVIETQYYDKKSTLAVGEGERSGKKVGEQQNSSEYEVLYSFKVEPDSEGSQTGSVENLRHHKFRNNQATDNVGNTTKCSAEKDDNAQPVVLWSDEIGSADILAQEQANRNFQGNQGTDSHYFGSAVGSLNAKNYDNASDIANPYYSDRQSTTANYGGYLTLENAEHMHSHSLDIPYLNGEAHSEDSPSFECFECKRTYKRKSYLDRHVQNAKCVKKKNQPLCLNCKLLFPTNHHLGSHKRYQHCLAKPAADGEQTPKRKGSHKRRKRRAKRFIFTPKRGRRGPKKSKNQEIQRSKDNSVQSQGSDIQLQDSNVEQSQGVNVEQSHCVNVDQSQDSAVKQLPSDVNYEPENSSYYKGYVQEYDNSSFDDSKGRKRRVCISQELYDRAKELIWEDLPIREYARRLDVCKATAYKLRKRARKGVPLKNFLQKRRPPQNKGNPIDNNDESDISFSVDSFPIQNCSNAEEESSSKISLKKRVPISKEMYDKAKLLVEKRTPVKEWASILGVSVSSAFNLRRKMETGFELFSKSRSKTNQSEIGSETESANVGNTSTSHSPLNTTKRKKFPKSHEKRSRRKGFIDHEKFERAKIMIRNMATLKDLTSELNISKSTAFKLRKFIRRGIPIPFHVPSEKSNFPKIPIARLPSGQKLLSKLQLYE